MSGNKQIIRSALFVIAYLVTSYCVFKTIRLRIETTDHVQQALQQRTSQLCNVTNTDAILKSVSETNCYRKQKNIVFLKVHKAGSTSLMNILIRFAMKNDLNVVLSSKLPVNILGHPGHSLNPRELIPPPKNETYNILCNHIVYNRKTFEAIMPRNTVYIGIVREPVSRFLSASFYFGFYFQLLSEFPIYKDKPEELFRAYFRDPDKFNHLKFIRRLIFNGMAVDFGMSYKLNNNTKTKEEIAKLDKEFRLIMVLEYFEESLVLMKRYLCWELKDIIFIPVNRRSRFAGVNVHLTDKDTEVVKTWNNVDVMLYQYFKSVLLEKMKAEGPTFYDEVREYKQILKRIQIFCNKRIKSSNFTVGESKWNEQFQVNFNDCKELTSIEVATMKIVKQKALEKLKKDNVQLQV